MVTNIQNTENVSPSGGVGSNREKLQVALKKRQRPLGDKTNIENPQDTENSVGEPPHKKSTLNTDTPENIPSKQQNKTQDEDSGASDQDPIENPIDDDITEEYDKELDDTDQKQANRGQKRKHDDVSDVSEEDESARRKRRRLERRQERKAKRKEREAKRRKLDMEAKANGLSQKENLSKQLNQNIDKTAQDTKPLQQSKLDITDSVQELGTETVTALDPKDLIKPLKSQTDTKDALAKVRDKLSTKKASSTSAADRLKKIQSKFFPALVQKTEKENKNDDLREKLRTALTDTLRSEGLNDRIFEGLSLCSTKPEYENYVQELLKRESHRLRAINKRTKIEKKINSAATRVNQIFSQKSSKYEYMDQEYSQHIRFLMERTTKLSQLDLRTMLEQVKQDIANSSPAVPLHQALTSKQDIQGNPLGG
ncbi:MAG: hypothetical protein AAF621_08000 [Pseudomonadota bacterium]